MRDDFDSNMYDSLLRKPVELILTRIMHNMPITFKLTYISWAHFNSIYYSLILYLVTFYYMIQFVNIY